MNDDDLQRIWAIPNILVEIQTKHLLNTGYPYTNMFGINMLSIENYTAHI
jgi:hypothetical protein